MASPPSINDPAFLQLDPDLRQAILRLTSNSAAIQYLSEFLVSGWLTCPRAIATASGNPRFYADALTSAMKGKGLLAVQVEMLCQMLNSLFATCTHPSSSASSSSSSSSTGSSPSPFSSPSPSSSTPKRASTSDSTGVAKKAKDEKPRTLDPNKLLLLNPEHARFWDYALVFAELLEPVHPEQSTCAGCHKTLSSTLPYNFWKHCTTLCSSRGDAFLEAAPLAAPSVAPSPSTLARFAALSPASRDKLPQLWGMYLNPQQAPAAARDAPAAALAGSPLPPPVPPPALTTSPIEETLPEMFIRGAGSFGSSASSTSMSAFFSSVVNTDSGVVVDPLSVFQHRPDQHSLR